MKDFLRRALGLVAVESLSVLPAFGAIVFKRRAVKLKYLGSPLRNRRRALEGSRQRGGGEDGIDYRYLKHIFIGSERLVTRVWHSWDSEDVTTLPSRPSRQRVCCIQPQR